MIYKVYMTSKDSQVFVHTVDANSTEEAITKTEARVVSKNWTQYEYTFTFIEEVNADNYRKLHVKNIKTKIKPTLWERIKVCLT